MILNAGDDNANDRETTLKITSTKFYVPIVTLSTKDNANLTKQLNQGFKSYVPIVTLSTKDNVNLTKQLNQGFKRYVYWNEYKSRIE